jgi:aminomethyltransferase
MVPFAGWEMPVQYTGIISEHLHTRSKASLFDVSHMGEFIIEGPQAGAETDRLVTCRLDNLTEGRCRYGFLLKPDGGILDDLIVFKIKADKYMLVVNAATTVKDSRWIRDNLSGQSVFRDISGETAKIDLQGPLSEKVMSRHCVEVGELGRFSFLQTEINGISVLISRTGYTGEMGYELFFPAASAETLWRLILEHPEVEAVGLGARDTLRLEKGYPLYGNDMDETRNPIEANMARFVYREKDFIGKEALPAGEEITHLLTGFICEGRKSARSHFGVSVSGRKVGLVTSGGFSPGLKKAIGLCYIEKELAREGQAINLSDNKAAIPAYIKSPPLYV